MTSSLRRKRQTIAPSIRTAKVRDREFRISDCGLGIAVLTVALASLLTSDAAAELQWRRGNLPAHSSESNILRQPKHAGSAIQQVDFEEDSPVILPTDYTGRASVRSVIIHRSPMRVAQAPDVERDQAAEEPDILSPFGELPPPDDLDFELPEQEEAQREYNLPSGPLRERPDAVGPPSRAPSQVYQGPPDEPSAEPDDVGTGIDRSILEDERMKALDVCTEEADKLRRSTLRDVDLRIIVTGTEGEDYPFECSIDHGQIFAGRCWPQITYLWKASALCHKPLFFEDVALERYGHTWGPYSQPFISGAHFFSRLPVLPYCMGITPPNECEYALGYYRPGSCAPYMIYPVPVTSRAALFQAGAVVGAAAAIP